MSHFTADSQAALANLRQPNQGIWSITPFFMIMLGQYVRHIAKSKWSHIFAALTFIGLDLWNEIMNSVFLHWSGYSALWTTSVGKTTYIPFVGWNIEIIITFLLAPLACLKFAPKEKTSVRIPIIGFVIVLLLFVFYPCAVIATDLLDMPEIHQLLDSNVHIALSAFAGALPLVYLTRNSTIGIPFSIVWSWAFSTLAVVFELFLNYTGLLLWSWKYWNIRFPWLIIPFGYFHFFFGAIQVYYMSRKKQIFTLSVIYLINFALMFHFGKMGWL
ncbi:hypothetical protein M0812_18958 [Anaeramoeba flamelloides]|uniref:Uncharacterized protein n=1 Tax=Anaeramoeba flamelloides TaxID=1746091 RepID=A0AAV7Z499_9EUKA|nr:hypothetical protein M0812_18958 [Anaeramoeba flamelloides]